MTRRQGILVGTEATILLLAACGALLASRAADWQPVGLVLLLFAMSVVSDRLYVEVRGLRVSGAFMAVMLSSVLLGPAPAVAISVASVLIDAAFVRLAWSKMLANLAMLATYPLVGGLLFRLLMGGASPNPDEGLAFVALVLLVFMATNAVNLAMVAAVLRSQTGRPVGETLGTAVPAALPSEFATGLLTAGVAFLYLHVGVGAVGILAVVVFIFQYLLRTGVAAFERGEELETRTQELASLQVGLLSTVMQTLSMRDAMTARHSAAVARYAREVAGALGLPEREQDLIHTAALLHDIGKFIFPDSILFADRKLTDEEWGTVKLHPEQGAKLVRRIEGYGPVADIILAHHERVDGKGYYRVPGHQVPLGSRIIAVADTYDVMTARDSYRRPVSREAAIVELRRVSGSQLDGEVVEAFIEVIESGRVAFRHTDAADFEQELAFERRVADYARPRVVAA